MTGKVHEDRGSHDRKVGKDRGSDRGQTHQEGSYLAMRSVTIMAEMDCDVSLSVSSTERGRPAQQHKRLGYM